MLLSLFAVVSGLVLLVWSAERFIDGASATATRFGMPPLLVGMVIVGFGTSAPEMFVSALSAMQGAPGLALGNAYGSNITNIALILGLTAFIKPITVHSKVLRRELPILASVTLLAIGQLWDGFLSRSDASVMLLIFVVLMFWTVWQGVREPDDSLSGEMERQLSGHALPLKSALGMLLAGLIFLVLSSRMLVWGAVNVARAMGVDDLIIGLTVVAIGTSLPELASSVMAARKGQHDIALGNVLGSNLFNTLAVVGIAGAIMPSAVTAEVLQRDMLMMGLLTASLFVFGTGFHGPGRINRYEGLCLLLVYLGYLVWVLFTAVPK